MPRSHSNKKNWTVSLPVERHILHFGTELWNNNARIMQKRHKMERKMRNNTARKRSVPTASREFLNYAKCGDFEPQMAAKLSRIEGRSESMASREISLSATQLFTLYECRHLFAKFLLLSRKIRSKHETDIVQIIYWCLFACSMHIYILQANAISEICFCLPHYFALCILNVQYTSIWYLIHIYLIFNKETEKEIVFQERAKSAIVKN